MQIDQKDREQIAQFVRRHPLGVISTLTERNSLNSSAVYVWCDESLSFYFSTKTNTQKYQNLMQYGQASLVVVDPRTLEEVQLVGRASKIDDMQKIAEALDTFRKIVAKESTLWVTPAHEMTNGVLESKIQHWIPPVSQLAGGEYVVFKIEPVELRYRSYESGETRANAFQEISAHE